MVKYVLKLPIIYKLCEVAQFAILLLELTKFTPQIK